MPSDRRSSSKKRLSTLIHRAITPSRFKSMPAFLHVKFAAGRPPESAADVPFVHELDVVKHPLPDSLKMDTQREGVVRYLKQTFAEGSYVHDVVHERERDSMYVLVTSNWKRSVGDQVHFSLLRPSSTFTDRRLLEQKLHLSLYVYQEEHHVTTWVRSPFLFLSGAALTSLGSSTARLYRPLRLLLPRGR